MSDFHPLPLRENLSLLPTSPGTLAFAALIVGVVAATSKGFLQWESLAFRNDLARTEWWRSFTYMLVHAGWAHALMNLALLYLYGLQLERLVGSPTLLVLGLGGGASGIVLLLAIWPTEGSSRGASEATFAILGALVAVHAVRSGWSSSTIGAAAATLVLLLAAGLLTIGGVGTLAAPGWQGVLYGMFIHAVGVLVGFALGLLATRLTGSLRPLAVAAVAAALVVGLTALGAHRWDQRFGPKAPAQAQTRLPS